MNILRALVIGLITIIGLAGVIAFVIMNYWGEQESADTPRVMAVFATKDIPEGLIITSDAVEEKEVPETRIPIDTLTSRSLAVGRMVKRFIRVGEAVGSHHLVPEALSRQYADAAKQKR